MLCTLVFRVHLYRLKLRRRIEIRHDNFATNESLSFTPNVGSEMSFVAREA